MAKKPAPFNNPFGGIKLARPEAAPRPGPKPAPAAPPEADEGALFRSHVGEVRRVTRGPAQVHPEPPRRDPSVPDPELEALAELAELVAGERELDLTDSDEFIEGAVAGLDPTLVRRLREGDFAVQGHLDLHGFSRADAKVELERFIAESRKRAHRCVLVVHGRGLHSKDQVPVLKESLQGWLARGRVGRQVLAFTTARPHDGGAGAVYVLLRK